MTNQKGKLGRFMLFGGLIGGAVSLFDRKTRKSIYNRMVQIKDGTSTMYQTIRRNPRQVSEELQQTAARIRLTAQEIADDMKEMVDKMEGASRSSSQAYRFAVEAGSEITQMAQKIKTTGQGIHLIQPQNTFKPERQIQEPNPKY